jgi:hypothetical protein
MRGQRIIIAAFLMFVAIIAVAVGYPQQLGLSVGPEARNTASLSKDELAPTNSPLAPEFATGNWINSEPLTLKGLRGRVVLI